MITITFIWDKDNGWIFAEGGYETTLADPEQQETARETLSRACDELDRTVGMPTRTTAWAYSS